MIDNIAILLSCMLVLYVAIRASGIDSDEEKARRAARRTGRKRASQQRSAPQRSASQNPASATEARAR